MGRFVQEDPTGVDGGINVYAFAGDDPVNGHDPSGAFRVFIDGVEVSGVDQGAVWGEIAGGGSIDDIVNSITDGNPYPVSGYSEGRTTYVTYSDGTVEMRNGGDPNWRNNNPGNLRPNTATGAVVDAIAGMFGEVGVSQSNFFIFGSENGGWLALMGVLGTPDNQASTIGQLIHRYAPLLDHNEPGAYTSAIERLTGFPTGTVIGSLDGEGLSALAGAIQRVEGTRRGIVTFTHP